MRSPLFLSLAGLACVACRSAPAPIAVSLDDEAQTAQHGAPEEWSAWMGLDEWGQARPIDWSAYLTGETSGSGDLGAWLPEDGCVFQIIQREKRTVRRWYVLVRPNDDGSGIELGNARMRLTEEARVIEIPLFFQHALVTVAPEGRELAPARDALLPLISSNFGYVISADESLLATYEEMNDSGEVTADVEDRFATAVFRPAVALLSLFMGIQKHPELSEILREVVDAPSILSIVLSGGLDLSLEPDLESVERCECPVGDAHFEPGVRFPASLSANGDPALEMEIYATESVRPVHLMGGLVGLRAWLPGDESRSVELRLVGARHAAAR